MKKVIVWSPELTSLNGQNIVTVEVIKILAEFFEIKKYKYIPGLNIFLIYFFYIRIYLKIIMNSYILFVQDLFLDLLEIYLFYYYLKLIIKL